MAFFTVTIVLQEMVFAFLWSLKVQGELPDGRYCERLYNMHINSPILQQMEECQRCILDVNYTKVNIDDIVRGLDTQQSSKKALKLKVTLKKYHKLFCGGLTLVDIMKPVSIKLKEGLKPHQGRYYYNIPKVY